VVTNITAFLVLAPSTVNRRRGERGIGAFGDECARRIALEIQRRTERTPDLEVRTA